MKLGVRGQLFAISLLLIVGVGLATGAFFESRLRDELRGRREVSLLIRARTAAVAAQALTGDHEVLVRELGKLDAGRVALFDGSGSLRASVGGPPSDRPDVPAPEVTEALATGSGIARRNDPRGDPILYAAVAFPPAPDLPQGVIRIAVPLDDADSTITALRKVMFLAGLVGLVLAVVMGGIAAELMVRAFRRMVTDAVSVATGEKAPSVAPASLGRPPSGGLDAAAAELERAVSDLAGERDRLETILERMTDAVLALDEDERITIANNAAFDLLHFDDDDVGRPLLEAVRLPVLTELAQRCQGEEDASIEFELPDPPHRQILARAAPLKWMGGVVIVMHDMTEIRRLERMRRDFVANVSHELRTPIAIIRANAETLLDGAIDDEQRAPEFVEAMHRSAERLNNLIGDLLDLSRIEAGSYATRLETLSVDVALETTLDALTAKAEGRRIELAVSADPDLFLRADRTALGQILLNLVDNAIKYSDAGGHVMLRARRVGPLVRIEVEDDGPGIEPHHRRRIFERFYRVDPSRSRDIGGTGLGLSIVRHLAEQMHGQVGVEAAPRRGSLFWVELPAAPADSQDELDLGHEDDAEEPRDSGLIRADAARPAR
ncbi:MAG: ATP-binding protein [Polyangiaceae bacterium]